MFSPARPTAGLCCVATRKASGYHLTREIQQMLKKLDGVKPATDAAQRDFYRKMAEKYEV